MQVSNSESTNLHRKVLACTKLNEKLQTENEQVNQKFVEIGNVLGLFLCLIK